MKTQGYWCDVSNYKSVGQDVLISDKIYDYVFVENALSEMSVDFAKMIGKNVKCEEADEENQTMYVNADGHRYRITAKEINDENC